jgi:hypothetical protein
MPLREMGPRLSNIRNGASFVPYLTYRPTRRRLLFGSNFFKAKTSKLFAFSNQHNAMHDSLPSCALHVILLIHCVTPSLQGRLCQNGICPAGTFIGNYDTGCNEGCPGNDCTMRKSSCGLFFEYSSCRSCWDCGCGPGEHANCDGSGTSNSCSKCPAGKFAPSGVLSATLCQQCPAGTFSLIGSTSCTSCVTCQPGEYTSCDVRGVSNSCFKCPAGKFATVGVASGDLCQKCPAGKYSSVGSARCTDCPDGTFSVETGECSQIRFMS